MNLPANALPRADFVADSKIAVIGPFYNNEAHVEGWLKALAKQTYPYFSIYVVDDGSTDRTVRLVRELTLKKNLPVTLLELKKNQGPSAARNQAIQKALSDGADLVILLDSDCRVPANWIENHLLFHQNFPDVHIMGGAIQGSAETAVGKADGFCSWFTAVPYSNSGTVRMHLSSTNMSIKSETFHTIGFFDEKLATGEDVAFCRKARMAGLLLWMKSDIVVTHIDRNELTAACRHHYRWGLHSYTLSLQPQGGYYGFLRRLKFKSLAALLVPVIAALNTLLILIQFSRRNPSVWLYLPWIVRLKWANAIGVYQGFKKPELCLRN